MKTNLPPQAYTRDVFANAYEWLQSQSVSIKELAQTPDDLVALYLQARRHGHLSNPTPTSKSFKNDLKNLAEGLRQFDDTQIPSASAVTEKVTETTKHSVTFSSPPAPNYQFKPQHVIEEQNFVEIHPPINNNPSNYNPTNNNTNHSTQNLNNSSPNPQSYNVFNNPPAQNFTTHPKNNSIEVEQQLNESTRVSTPNLESSLNFDKLDKKTRFLLDESKELLNLSQNEEVLRLVVVLGHQRLKELFRKRKRR
jgi:hypothetical protein